MEPKQVLNAAPHTAANYQAPSTSHVEVETEGGFCASIEAENADTDNGRITVHEVNDMSGDATWSNDDWTQVEDD